MNDQQPKTPQPVEIRLLLALKGRSEDLFQLVLDPAMEVLRNLLKNPQLTEEHLLILLKRRDLNDGLLKGIAEWRRGKLSHRLQLALVRNPATPTATFLNLLPQLFLFELLELCSLPGTTPEQRLAAERQVILRLPGEELGNKLSLARRSPYPILQALVREGEPRVIQVCLDNPHLKEAALLQFLRSGKADAESISQIARHPRWQQRQQLRQTILKNPRTPAVWYTLWLPRTRSGELRNLAAQRTLLPGQHKLVTEELKKRGLG